MLRELGVAVVVPPGLEADDVLASVARAGARARAPRTVVVTSDRDAFGLIDATTRVLRIINGGVEASPLLTAERLVTLLGVRPEQYRDFAALRGDPSDNLPGVRGIGPKHGGPAAGRVRHARAAFDDLDARCADAARPRRWPRGSAEPEARATWELNCQVMAMRADVAVDLSGGAGALPLPSVAVRATFGSLELPWTAATALRVLAGDLSVPSPPAPVEPDWNPPPRRGRSLPPLRKRPVVDQLALF